MYEPIQRCHRYLDDGTQQQQQQRQRQPLLNHDQQANHSTPSDGSNSFSTFIMSVASRRSLHSQDFVHRPSERHNTREREAYQMSQTAVRPLG